MSNYWTSKVFWSNFYAANYWRGRGSDEFSAFEAMVSEAILLDNVRDYLVNQFSFSTMNCGVELTGQPSGAFDGNITVVVHPESVVGISGIPDAHDSEQYNFAVTVSQKTGWVPTDRDGDITIVEPGDTHLNHLFWDIKTELCRLPNAADIIFEANDDIESQNPGVNDVQTITSTLTSGTFTLRFRRETSASIAWNASAATVQTALTNLGTIGASDVSVTGTGPWVVTFQGDLQKTPVMLLESATSGITITRTTKGKALAVFGISDFIRFASADPPEPRRGDWFGYKVEDDEEREYCGVSRTLHLFGPRKQSRYDQLSR